VSQHHPGMTGFPLDRSDWLRNDAEAYGKILNDWRGRLLGFDGPDPLISNEGGLVWHSMADAAFDAELVLLGLRDDKPHFAAITTQTDFSIMRSPSMWKALTLLAAEEAAIFGAARSVIDWHNVSRFCGRCGGATTLFRAGWGRRCETCNTEHFPRTDPVVIMLAEFEGKVLVGRQSRFPPGNYSALAGFLEPGESMEEAVRRELFEESGIRTGAVRYVASQPWPFGGSQLMMACVADAEADAITLDTNELEDAIWVTRDEVIAALEEAENRRFTAPPRFAIAHTLLLRWVEMTG
jgi:NAD+ diphosphatase